MNNPQKLRLWCRLDHGNTTRLAKAIGWSREMVYHWRQEKDAEKQYKPDEETAKKIEDATDGAVPAADW